MNVYDYDDGLEDILYNHHDLICILKGTDATHACSISMLVICLAAGLKMAILM